MREDKYTFLVLEDRPNSPEWIEFCNYFEARYRDEVLMMRCSTPLKFVGTLKGLDEKNMRPSLIVIDIMIPEIKDLGSIGLMVETGNGFLAGLVFAREWLRRAEGPYRSIPLLFWTALTKSADIERNIEILAQVGPIGYVTKNTSSQWAELEAFLGKYVFAQQ